MVVGSWVIKGHILTTSTRVEPDISFLLLLSQQLISQQSDLTIEEEINNLLNTPRHLPDEGPLAA